MKAEYLQVSVSPHRLPINYKREKDLYMEKSGGQHLDQVINLPVKRETDITCSLMRGLEKEIGSLV